jgi:outer membrane protein TolC
VERVAQQEEAISMAETRMVAGRATLVRLNAEIAQIDAALAILS